MVARFEGVGVVVLRVPGFLARVGRPGHVGIAQPDVVVLQRLVTLGGGHRIGVIRCHGVVQRDDPQRQQQADGQPDQRRAKRQGRAQHQRVADRRAEPDSLGQQAVDLGGHDEQAKAQKQGEPQPDAPFEGGVAADRGLALGGSHGGGIIR